MTGRPDRSNGAPAQIAQPGVRTAVLAKRERLRNEQTGTVRAASNQRESQTQSQMRAFGSASTGAWIGDVFYCQEGVRSPANRAAERNTRRRWHGEVARWHGAACHATARFRGAERNL